MKEPNQNRALFDAITNIDDELIDEAAAPRVLPLPKTVRRIAAVAAVLCIICTLLLLDGKKTHAPVLSVYAYAEGMDGVELLPNGEKVELSNEDEQRYEELYNDYLGDIFELIIAPPSTAFAPDFYIRIAFAVDSREFLLNWRSEYSFKVLVDGEVLMEGEEAYKRIERDESMEVIEGVLSLRNGNVEYAVAGAVNKPTKLQFVVATKYGTIIEQYDLLVTPRGEGELQEIELIYACMDGECVFEKGK